MGLLNRGKKEPDIDEQRAHEITVAEESRPTMEQDYVNALGKLYYMIKDDQEAKLLWDDAQLRNLIPAFSALNSLSNIDEREARIRMLKYKILMLKQKAYMNTKTYASGGATLISSLELRSRSIVTDAFHGWKGKITTEQTKRITTVLEKKKKGWI